MYLILAWFIMVKHVTLNFDHDYLQFYVFVWKVVLFLLSPSRGKINSRMSCPFWLRADPGMCSQLTAPAVYCKSSYYVQLFGDDRL